MVEARFSSPVESRNGPAEQPHHVDLKVAASRDPIEEGVLIEAVHLDNPVDRRARAAQSQRAVALAGDRRDTAVDGWRRSSIQGDLGFTQDLAPIDRRGIKVVVADGALELPRARTRDEDDRRMRVDTLDRRASMR